METIKFSTGGDIIFSCYETQDGGAISCEHKGDCKLDRIMRTGKIEELKELVKAIDTKYFIS